MKVCPVCSESFGDEFSFCDLDGTKLKRDAASPPAQSKMGSLLGVGLLIGAVAVTAAAIIFMRKAPVSPVVARSSAAQSAAPAPAKPAGDDAIASSAIPDQGDLNANLPAVIAKKKSQDLTNANMAGATTPDAKAAAQPGATADAAPQPDAITSTPPAATPNPEPPVVETRAPESAPKSVEPPAERKESKPATKNGKESDDKKKKDEDKDKKKGGGFLKVFKKIFGKD